MCVESKQLMGWTLGLIQNQQISETYNKFIAAVLQKGGAEGWVQVELAEIYNTLPNTAWVQREQPIFLDPNKEVDFLIKCKDGPTACVELKVESLFKSSDEGRVTMPHTRWQGVSADVEKLRTGRNQTHAGDRAFAVAFVWSEEATAGMDSWLKIASLTFEREQYPVTHGTSKWVFTVYVITV